MSELTEEEKALLAEAEAHEDIVDAPAPKRATRRKAAEEAPVEQVAVVEHGPYTPAQFGDDGWGDLPVQYRS